jgi:hypothetical protein
MSLHDDKAMAVVMKYDAIFCTVLIATGYTNKTTVKPFVVAYIG